ncbi:MAG: transporter substrate-binding domain-containing protein [Deltaproteobacteria bacterium]|nr:transporter substrate-binding domain-containing protein [Deltaproteobacteria bacterium]
MIIRALLVLILFLGSASSGFAETITLGAENDWAPYANPDGTGMANDIVSAAYKAVGIDVAFKVAPYNRLLKEVREGAILGAFDVPKESANEKDYIFGTTPLFVAHSAYYHNKDHPLSAEKKEDLVNGEKIGIVFDYGYGDFFAKNDRIIKIPVRSDLLNVRKLAKGRIDATILYDKTADKIMAENDLNGKILKAFESESSNIYVAFSRTFPKAEYYAKKLDEGLAIIKSNGIYNRIVGDH